MSTEGQRKKPMVDGMHTRHVDYKYGRNKLSDAEKRARQVFQSIRVASKRQARKNGADILAALAS